MSSTRQLAAIMFTDIVGYTALMGSNEKKAFELLQKNREIQKPIIEKFNGRLIKELGDGILACFTTVTDAVHAALKIQEACYASKDFQLRIGIHQGEVVFEANDIFGDAVNIASRIQALTAPGGIYISESVHNNASNQDDITTKFVKQETLKNVKEPVRIYEVITILATASSHSATKESLKKSSEKSIAVLPFVNMSNDPEQEYFSDGMAEEILNSLAHIKELKVAGRTSAFQFKGKNIDLREVGDKLGVSNVLEGSVRKQGNRLRITAQLINVDNGFHLWSERFDRDMDDIFAIQDEIALAITEKLKITLLGNDRELITKTITQNTAAYELYLKGRFYLSRRGKFVLTALEYFQQAIDLDPGFAVAYAGYADANFISAFYSFLPGNVVMSKGKEAAEKAIKLDPSLCEPYASLGYYYMVLTWEWEKGKENYLRSLQLNPGYAFGHYLFGLYYYAWVTGNFKKAEEHGQLSIQLDPLSSIAHAIYSLILLTAGKTKDALAIAKTGIELDANSFLCHRSVSLTYRALKRFEEAIEAAEHLIKISNRHPHAICDLMLAYSETGNMKEVKMLMQELKQRSANEFIDAAMMGLAAAYTGNLDEAFTYFDTALIERDPMLITLKYLNYSDSLASDPRYGQLLERIGFPRQ